MFHKAINLDFLQGTVLEVTFQDGKVIRYDMSALFCKYPQLEALKDRELFLSGTMSPYGIRWNDDLDIEMETIYEDGEHVRDTSVSSPVMVAYAVAKARLESGYSQKQLAGLTGIDQSDISKIERGVANPSVSTLERIAEALGAKLTISID